MPKYKVVANGTKWDVMLVERGFGQQDLLVAGGFTDKALAQSCAAACSWNSGHAVSDVTTL